MTGSLEPEYEYSVTDLGFSTNVTLTDLRTRKDFWELCNSNGQEETKRFERMKEKKDKFIQDPREKRKKRWQGQPSVRGRTEPATHDVVSQRKLIGRRINLELSPMPGIILNPVDKIKYEKAIENLLISKMRRVCMFPEDDADDHEEETWNCDIREQGLEKREKEKGGKEQRIVFLKSKKEMIDDDKSVRGEQVLPRNMVFSANSINCTQNISKTTKPEQQTLHNATQPREPKWKSSEYFPKMPMRCQATTSSRVKTYRNGRKPGPDLDGVLVCKSVSGDMENRSELMNKIIEGLFPEDGQSSELKQKKTPVETPQTLGTETVQDDAAGPSRTAPEECSKQHVREITKHKKIKNITLRLTSREQGRRPLVTSQQEVKLTKNEDVPQTTSEPSLSMVCLKKLFPNAKLELY